MKKGKIIAIIGAAVVLIAGVVVAIVIATSGNNGGGENNGGNDTSTNGGSEVTSDSIVGEWKYVDSALGDVGTDFIYTFNADGSGNYNAGGTDMPFTYTTEGNQIAITYTSSGGTFESEYEIKDNVLNIKDSGGNDTLYKRVK